MTRPVPRTRVRVLLALTGLGAVLGTALGAALLPVTARAASPSPRPEPEDPVRVTVSQLLPRAPRAGGPITVAGYLRNDGRVPITSLRVRLQVGALVDTRSELQQADQDRPPTFLRTFAVPTAAELPPGATTAFVIRTTTGQLGMSRIGVYPLDVVARGDAGDGIESLGFAPTWLPYFDGTTPRPTRVSVVWPLVDRPRLQPDGTLPEDDDLGELLAPGGRLGRLVTTARAAQVAACEPPATGPDRVPDPAPRSCDPVTVAFAVDGELLDAVQVLARSSGADGATAKRWLEDLRGAGLGGRVLALPYADPDVSALARSSRTRDDIATAQALSAEVVRSVLAVDPTTAVAWPPPGTVSPAAADALALSGARSFVLDPTAFDGAPLEGSVPSTAALFATSATGASLRGLVVDPDLSELLARSTPYGARVTEQRFLAETAIVAAEQPSVSRTLVLALPRRADVPAAAAEALRDLGRVPWLCDVSLVSVAAGEEACPRQSGPPSEPADRGELSSDDSAELPPAYLGAVALDRDRATQLTDAVLSGTPSAGEGVAALKAHLRRAVARAESSAGREDPELARHLAADLHDEVEELTGQVVVRGGRSLLTSDKGRLSVSIENTLSMPVQLRVRFTSKTATLDNTETGLVTVQAGHAVEASVEARAQRSGQFVVFARLVDREGRPFGPETEIIVRSTAFGRVALAVTLAATAVLFIAAGTRIALRVRAARRAEGP